MKRRLFRALAGLAFLAGAAVLLAFATLRASLPDLDGEIGVAGIGDAVTIERDPAGIPTITARNRADLAFATGYAHAQDRFFQMDLIRRRAAGELAELFGEVAVATDKQRRFHRFRTRARAVMARMTPDDRQIIESYSRGVNAGISSLGARPFEYIFLGSDPADWRPEDTLLVVYTMFLILNDERGTADVRRGLVRRIVPEEVYDWLYPRGTNWDAPLVGDLLPSQTLPSADVFSVRSFSGEAPPSREVGKPALNGSNNWAVGGSLTASGRALVANDMHLGLSVPNIFYRARLLVDGDHAQDVVGVTLPGAPFVVAGSNTHIAWSYTNSYGDWTDAVVLRPGSVEGSYRTPEGDREFDSVEETIIVKGAAPVTFRIRETIWGPVDEDAGYPDGDIAVCWTAHFPEAVNLRLVDLERASSVDEALDVANSMGIPPENFIVGDADGNIGWTIAGRIPLRNGHAPMLPVDWSETGGWSGWLASENYPRILNPDSGRLWTANSRVVDGEALARIGDNGYDLGARARQIRDSLFSGNDFEPADMLAIQLDDRALFLQPWRDLLLEILDEDTISTDPRLAEFRHLVADWIPRAAPESVGYRLLRAFRLEVQARVFHGLTAPVREAYGDAVKLRISNQFEAPLWSLVTQRPLHLLPGDYASWNELMIEAVHATIAYLDSNYGKELSSRNWGERNMTAIRHPLSSSMPWLAEWLDMPHEPVSGDVDMPKAQGRSFGASERFSVSPGDEENGLMHMPGGQSGHPLSPFYRSGHRDWLLGRPSPFLPGPTQHKLTLQAVE